MFSYIFDIHNDYILLNILFSLFQHFEIVYLEKFITLLLGLYLFFWFSCLYYLVPLLVIHFLNIPPTVSIYNIELCKGFHVECISN